MSDWKLLCHLKAVGLACGIRTPLTWHCARHTFGTLQVIQKSSNLHFDEMCAGEKAMVRDNELTGYAPLYPLSAIIALAFLLDSMEAHLFRKYVCHKVQQPATSITPIFLFGGTHH